MTIEFNCPFCDRLLRTPAEKAGLQANCPNCGEKVFIPHESETFDTGDEFDETDSAGGRDAGSAQNGDWFDQLADLEAKPQPDSETPAAPVPAAEEIRACPMCGEEIDIAADACPACGEQFSHKSGTGRRGQFRPEYAGFCLRFVAALIDGLVIGIPIVVVAIAVTLLAVEARWAAALDQVPDQVWNLLAHAIIWPYYALMESSRLQATVGKLAMGIIVTDMEGDRVTFARASGRHFGKLLSEFCCMLGYIVAAFDVRKQAWHDSISSCLVIRRP